jgi:hypothetical protein
MAGARNPQILLRMPKRLDGLLGVPAELNSLFWPPVPLEHA